MGKSREHLIIYRNVLTIIYLSLIVLFCYFCMQSGADSTESSSFFTEAICNLFGITKTDEIAAFVRKAIGHFGFFCVFGLVSMLLYMSFYKISYKRQLLIHFGTGIAYIFMTEFLFQAIAINRGPSFKDCLIDFSGFLLMSLIVMLMYYIIVLIKKKNINNNKKFMLVYTIITGIIYATLIIVYCILSLQNSQTSGEVGTNVGQTVVNITPGVSADITTKSASVQQFIRKVLGHFGYFAIIGFFSYLFYISFNKKLKMIYLMIIHFAVGITFAFLTEFLFEAVTTGRSPSIKDFFTDSIGFVSINVFVIITIYLLRFYIRVKNRYGKGYINLFYGKYYKFISDDNYVLACIISHSNEGDMIQIINNEGSYLIEDLSSITINDNVITFNVNIPNLKIDGTLTLGELNPLSSNVMGPFKYLPLECKHQIYSMKHYINGSLNINDINHSYTNSLGYIEGDSGTNFPKKYIWYNSVTSDATLTFAIATIPLFGFIKFKGLLCFIKTDNKEYKICTYNFGKVKKMQENEIVLCKGKYKLVINFNEFEGHKLKAPVKGNMERHIKEAITVPSKYKLTYNDETILEIEDSISSLEYMWD